MYYKSIETNKITFTDARFYRSENGTWIPSVTTILEAYPKPYELLQWMKEQGSNADKIKEAAGKRGSIVHELTERYDKLNPGERIELLDSFDNPNYSLFDEWAMFERYVDFSTRFNPLNYLIEESIVSTNLNIAGTIDRICEINGERYIVDIKTSNGIYPSYWLQLAAYRKLYYDWAQKDLYTIEDLDAIAVDGCAILWLNAKTKTNGKSGDIQGPGWQLIIKDNDFMNEQYKIFECVKQVWLAEHPNDKPKQYCFQTSYEKPLKEVLA